MSRIRWDRFEDAVQYIEESIANQSAKPLSLQDFEMQLRRLKLTKEQEIYLRQRYMDTLEYNEDQQFVICCGGIKPLLMIPPPDEEESLCTEQF